MKQALINRRQFLKGAAAIAGAVGLMRFPELAGHAVAAPAASASALPRLQTLYLSGIQWGKPTNYNPLGGAGWPCAEGYEEIYETLFAYNPVTNNLDPLLAKSLEFSADNLTVTITLDGVAKWQDGQPITAEDVLYTYTLPLSQPNISYSAALALVSNIMALDPTHIQIDLNPTNVNLGAVKHYLGIIKILPMHIWQSREAQGPLADYVELNPVGSGPYKLHTTDDTRIVLERDDAYWGKARFGLPRPKYLVHSLYATSDDVLAALAKGDLDLSATFMPQLAQVMNESKRMGSWFSAPPYQFPSWIPLLFINTTKPGLDNALVRRALAYSINYGEIAQTAMTGLSDTAKSSLILPTGPEKQFFDQAQVAAYGWEYDPAKAKAILENDLHAVKGTDGIYVLPGDIRLGPWKVQTPDGWTDWMAACDIIAKNAQAAGFDITAAFPDFSTVYGDTTNGTFDMSVMWAGKAGPMGLWSRFHDVLDDRGVPPTGQPADFNYGRFSSAEADTLLDQSAATADPTQQKPVFQALDKIMMDNAPVIPLMYRPDEFYEFNASVWSGFPTSDNPVAPPIFTKAGIQMLYHLTYANQVRLPQVTKP